MDEQNIIKARITSLLRVHVLVILSACNATATTCTLILMHV